MRLLSFVFNLYFIFHNAISGLILNNFEVMYSLLTLTFLVFVESLNKKYLKL